MFGWLKRKPARDPDAPPLYDVHCHLMPGVDDGCASEDETVQCIQGLIDLGYRGAVLTPHINELMFPNDEAYLRERFRMLLPRMAERFPGFELALGAEYMLDEYNWEKLLQQPEQMLTFGPPAPGRPHLLMEIDPAGPGDALLPVIDRCNELGWTLIVAHIERYHCIHAEDGAHQATGWASRGALLQVNLGSFNGHHGKRAKAAAEKLRAAGLIHLLGTDLHSPTQLKRYRYDKAWQQLNHMGLIDPMIARARQAVCHAPP